MKLKKNYKNYMKLQIRNLFKKILVNYNKSKRKNMNILMNYIKILKPNFKNLLINKKISNSRNKKKSLKNKRNLKFNKK